MQQLSQQDPTPPSLDAPELYINRELSLLEFNRRVLAQAKDPANPLLERLRFLTICSTNLDEFFEIRVSGVKQQISFGVVQRGADGLLPQEALSRISERAHELVTEQYRVLNEELLPALAEADIRLLRRTEWSGKQRRWMQHMFNKYVLPVLTPIGLDPAHPFPRIVNKSLNFIVRLEGTDAFGRQSEFAVVQAPRSLPRIIRMPPEVADGPDDFVLLSSVIHSHVEALFPGMQVTGCYQFRVTRNSDLWVEEEDIDDLLQAIEGELLRRNYGDAVRLEVADNCPPDISQFLLDLFKLEEEDLYQVNGPVNLYRLAQLYERVNRPTLKYPRFVPATPRSLTTANSIFEAISRQDMLLHHPFEAFTPVVDLVRQAAADPDVLAIKQTLYRTDTDSPIVEALLQAARAGKEVTVLVELRARFDEAANIDLATQFHDAGANVVYGMVGHKTHAKMLLVVRREGDQLRRYVHLGTGNYHTKTARAYTDLSLMTCRQDIGEDVHKLFVQLTGVGKEPELQKLWQSPFTLHERLIEHIEKEAQEARQGRPARIMARMNSLHEPSIIKALYRASQAGVAIDLIVRGICCLRPGVPGVSENISVRSVVGRFLEHSRTFYFYAGGEELLFGTSADWMERNFFRRVETAFPIENATLHRRVREETLDLYLHDNTQAWLLQSDGAYRRAQPDGTRWSAQQTLLYRLSRPGSASALSAETLLEYRDADRS